MKRTLLGVLLLVSCAAARAHPEVNLRVNLSAPEDALLHLFRQSGENFVFAPMGPIDRRVSLDLCNMPVELAVSRLCDEAGLKFEQRAGGFVITCGPALFTSQTLRSALGGSSGLTGHASALNPLALGALAAPGLSRQFATFGLAERSTFTCPHCKRSVTILGLKDQCGQCQRQLQRGWTYCPFDGAKRTTLLEDWKACPFCLKGVKNHAQLPAPDPRG